MPAPPAVTVPTEPALDDADSVTASPSGSEKVPVVAGRGPGAHRGASGRLPAPPAGVHGRGRAGPRSDAIADRHDDGVRLSTGHWNRRGEWKLEEGVGVGGRRAM